MSAPSSYTEAELAAYMAGELDAVGTELGLTEAAPRILQAVAAVERLLGVADVSVLTDMATLEAAARWEAWRAASGAAAAGYDVSLTGGKKFTRSQMFAQIQYKLAEAEAAYYAAVSASEAASGTSPGFFFRVACGGRGR